jgi:hypothetical protein
LFQLFGTAHKTKKINPTIIFIKNKNVKDKQVLPSSSSQIEKIQFTVFFLIIFIHKIKQKSKCFYLYKSKTQNDEGKKSPIQEQKW